jgi:hypothetical protein
LDPITAVQPLICRSGVTLSFPVHRSTSC